MKVLFLQNIWREYFGFMSLSAVLREGRHATRIAVIDRPADALREVEAFRPGLACFSFTHCEQAWVLEAAQAIKERHPGLPIVIGGPHPTLHPELALRPQIDAVCRGEGEQTLLELAEELSKGGDWRAIRNLCHAKDGTLVQNEVRPLIEDLDSLPFPDREGYYRYGFLRNNPVKYFFTGRGRPYNCTFCFNRAFRSIYPNRNRYVRHFSVDRVLSEIGDVKSRYPMRMVRFEDDVFTLDKKWLHEFLQFYGREFRVPYLCYIRAGEPEETIALLKETGCHTVLFGIETGDEARRNDLLAKGVTNDQIRATAALLHKHRLHFFTTNMLALPGETWEDALKTLRLNQEIRVPDAWCSVFQPYAGLPITDYAVEHGFLTEASDQNVGINTFTNNVLRQKDADRIFNLHKFFYPLARWPRLEPLLLPLTRLPPNRLFHYVFVFFYAYSYTQHSEVGIVRLGREALRWFRLFLSELGRKKAPALPPSSARTAEGRAG